MLKNLIHETLLITGLGSISFLMTFITYQSSSQVLITGLIIMTMTCLQGRRQGVCLGGGGGGFRHFFIPDFKKKNSQNYNGVGVLSSWTLLTPWAIAPPPPPPVAPRLPVLACWPDYIIDNWKGGGGGNCPPYDFFFFVLVSSGGQ